MVRAARFFGKGKQIDPDPIRSSAILRSILYSMLRSRSRNEHVKDHRGLMGRTGSIPDAPVDASLEGEASAEPEAPLFPFADKQSGPQSSASVRLVQTERLS